MNKIQRKQTSKYLFESKNEITTTCLLFTADWCDACKDIDLLFKNKSLQLKSQVNFKKINVDDEDTDYITIQYKIVSVPTIVIISDGKITNYINDKITEDILNNAIMNIIMKNSDNKNIISNT
jgi:thioredoxin-like negative regulator of GroEL